MNVSPVQRELTRLKDELERANGILKTFTPALKTLSDPTTAPLIRFTQLPEWPVDLPDSERLAIVKSVFGALRHE